MTRSFSTGFRNQLESIRSDGVLVHMAVIDHDDLAEPIRIVNDVVDYVFEGETYLGFPFAIELLTDDDRPPRGRLTVQNVDRSIGEAVRSIDTAPTVRIMLLADQDFASAVDGNGVRQEVGSPTPEYDAPFLLLQNVEVDAMTVSGELNSYDPTSEPWPAIRSTPDRLPGLEP